MIEMSHTKSMSGLISVFLLAVVGLALTPTIVQSVGNITVAAGGSGNLTGAALTIMTLFPMFWVILMIAIPVAYVAIWLKGS